MEDDLDLPMSRLNGSGHASIVSQLLNIQKFQLGRRRSFEWAKTLTCLSPVGNDKRLLRKVSVDIADGNYVAVSYKSEEIHSRRQNVVGYHVTPESSQEPKLSAVPVGVVERVIKYMRSFHVPTFWIDQECIDQDSATDLEVAMQSMDLVYRCSNHPVGLLSTQIRHQDELDLLLALVSGHLVVDRHPELQPNVTFEDARKTLSLLDHIMHDPWWTRRWIFQEEYCSYRRPKRKMMVLLVPHELGLAKTGWDKHSLSVDGEVLVKAAKLRTQATLFCLACEKQGTFQSEKDVKLCESVLNRIKSYKILHDFGDDLAHEPAGHPMSIQILSDIVDRAVTKPGDTLAIIANCCGYNVRLDRSRLEQNAKISLSLAVLALCLLNGEILWSKKRGSPNAAILDFLQAQTFDRFDPPLASRQLTFMKKTRLVDVRLVADGVQTSGHLWRLRRTIDTKSFHLDLGPDADDQQLKTKCLRRLVSELYRLSYRSLATHLGHYLHKDLVPSHLRAHAGLAQIFVDTIHRLCASIAAGDDLVVVQHLDSRSHWGIFTFPAVDNERTPDLIFTAHEPAEYDDLVQMFTSPDKYVSLAVALADTDSSTIQRKGTRRLKVESWVNGVTFPPTLSTSISRAGRSSVTAAKRKKKKMERDVVFPWPEILTQQQRRQQQQQQQQEEEEEVQNT